jgi:hypothetical protein
MGIKSTSQSYFGLETLGTLAWVTICWQFDCVVLYWKCWPGRFFEHQGPVAWLPQLPDVTDRFFTVGPPLSLPGLLKILQLDFKQLWRVSASMLRHVQENLVCGALLSVLKWKEVTSNTHLIMRCSRFWSVSSLCHLTVTCEGYLEINLWWGVVNQSNEKNVLCTKK